MIKPPKTYFLNEFLPKLNIGKVYEDKALLKILKYDENIKFIKTNDDYKFDFELSYGLKH